jgi:hypothetical protein
MLLCARSLISIAIRRMPAVARREDYEHLGEIDNGHSVVLDWVMGSEFRLNAGSSSRLFEVYRSPRDRMLASVLHNPTTYSGSSTVLNWSWI